MEKITANMRQLTILQHKSGARLCEHWKDFTFIHINKDMDGARGTF